MKRLRGFSLIIALAMLLSCFSFVQAEETEIVTVVEGQVLSTDVPVPGDYNRDSQVDTDDVVYLLRHRLFPQIYPIYQSGDTNSDGEEGEADVVYFLRHTLFPTVYPLFPGQKDPNDYTYTTGQTHTPVPYTQRYMYNTLNEEQKGWYRKIDAAVNNLEDRVSLGSGILEGENYLIYYIYMMDHPEHFYMTNQVGMYGYGADCGLVLGYSDGVSCSGYGYGGITPELKASIREKQARFNAEAEKILSTIPADAPDAVKEKLIYDRILIDAYYNLDAQWDGLAEDNWTAYGVMVNKYGVCESYAEAFQHLCLMAGINCTGITGTAGGGHKWNAVELDGQWYACDVTFDDPIGGDSGVAGWHTYFNCTTEEMEYMNHSTEGSRFPGPVCEGTKYSYKNYFQ